MKRERDNADSSGSDLRETILSCQLNFIQVPLVKRRKFVVSSDEESGMTFISAVGVFLFFNFS